MLAGRRREVYQPSTGTLWNSYSVAKARKESDAAAAAEKAPVEEAKAANVQDLVENKRKARQEALQTEGLREEALAVDDDGVRPHTF
jgi:hypothetical protein